ncbi:MAG: hypothetical protein HOP31_09540, partial [Ignavibacteria bacterium]|nr:hypothetical protein [Ignavibacteria bacterium]
WIFCTVFSLHAQSDKIRIILKQPPPNLMGVGNMWDLTLDNTSGGDLKIYLLGTATEDKDGLIIEGKSKVFTIKPGKTSYKYSDFSGAEIKYNNGRYKEIILRTGNAPEGNYTICVSAFNESGEVIGSENCITQPVQQTGSISLISPSDGEEVDPVQPIVFSWTPLPKAEVYTLKIVEIKGEQSPDVAMKQNRAILEVNDIKTTTHHVAPSQVKVIMMGMKCAWQVSSGDVQSEVWSFKMMSAQYQVIVDTVIIRCDSLTPNKYNYQVKVRNNNPNGSPGPLNPAKASIVLIFPSPLVSAPTIPTTPSPVGGIPYMGSYVITGSATFSSFPSFLDFTVKMEDNTNPIGFNATTVYRVNTPMCNKNCCENFKRTITNISIIPASTPGAYQFNATLTAGPNKIKKIVANMNYFEWKLTNEACKKCNNSSLYWGNVNSVPSPTLPGFSSVSFTPSGSVNSYSHEVIWTGNGSNMNSGVPLNMYLIFPLKANLSCCSDTIKFCINFSFTDTTCATCDTSICYTYIRNVTTGMGKIYDEKIQKMKIDDELMEEENKDNEEYKKSYEEQEEMMKKKQFEGESQGYRSKVTISKRAVRNNSMKAGKK